MERKPEVQKGACNVPRASGAGLQASGKDPTLCPETLRLHPLLHEEPAVWELQEPHQAWNPPAAVPAPRREVHRNMGANPALSFSLPVLKPHFRSIQNGQTLIN